MNENKSDLKMLHNFEELETTMFNMARILGTYYTELIKQGVPDELAQALVVAYQTSIFSHKKD